MNRKVFLAFFLVFCFVFSFSVSAEKLSDEPITKDFLTDRDLISTDLISEYELVDENGDILIFSSKEDYELHKEFMNLKDENTINLSVKNELISSVRKNHLWVGYHSGTPNWYKASRYTISKGKSYSTKGSYNYEGFTIDLSFSYSTNVSATIPADSNRYSRLGVWGDFTFKKYKHSTYRQGKWHSYYYVTKTRHNKYIKPKYK
ncbi:hypothetical protein [Bacillus sp. FJAT-47783]|uniref:hypothetical protein n=1 Tax=Bacillus sp. FJAT-47783 TaxID=2922712 RepID=UPI001FAD0ED0|nr:hypothetical protein [Bacillus sp. FJAT-47783]